MKNKKILYVIIGVVAVLAIIIGIGVHKNNSKPENAFSNTTWKVQGDSTPYWSFSKFDDSVGRDESHAINKVVYNLKDEKYASDASFLEGWNGSSSSEYYTIVGNTIYLYGLDNSKFISNISKDKKYNEKYAIAKLVLKKSGNGFLVTHYTSVGPKKWNVLGKNLKMTKVGKAVQN